MQKVDPVTTYIINKPTQAADTNRNGMYVYQRLSFDTVGIIEVEKSIPKNLH